MQTQSPNKAQLESWNLEMLIFTEGGKPEKNPYGKGENQQTTQLT
jgi:hypothetical protein